MKIRKRKKGKRSYFMCDYRDRNGDRHREHFHTKAEAESRGATIKLQLDRNEFVNPKSVPNFSMIAKEWLAEKIDRRPGTVSNWEQHVRLHITPNIGDLKPSEITVARMERFRDELRAKNLAPRSVNAVLTTTSSMFAMAERRGYCHRNPVARMERAYLGAGELTEDSQADSRSHLRAVDPQEVLLPVEVKKVIESATPGRDKTFLVTALMTGARVGELLALRWTDIELRATDGEGRETGMGQIHVRRTLSWARVHRATGIEAVKGPIVPRVFSPKTRSGSRTIDIPHEAVLALKEWKLQCPLNDDDLVFPGRDGRPMHRSRPLPDILRPVLRSCEIRRRVTVHGLRHTFASIHVLNGTSLTELQTLLGHANPSITMKTYLHWFRGLETRSVERFAESIFSARTREDQMGTRRAPGVTEELVANGAKVA